jgi:hypothetical protein
VYWKEWQVLDASPLSVAALVAVFVTANVNSCRKYILLSRPGYLCQYSDFLRVRRCEVRTPVVRDFPDSAKPIRRPVHPSVQWID